MTTTPDPGHTLPGGAVDAAAPAHPDDGSIVWTESRLLGFGPMDRTHEDFYRVAFDLLRSTEASMLEAIDAFEAHAIEHFGQEEQWMRETAFPGGECHFDEHAAVLASVREVREAAQVGRIGPAVVHALAEHLFRWFPGHADYMDSALATWMSQRQWGGQPVVLRRRVAE
mgnify:CR=1 FL=1